MIRNVKSKTNKQLNNELADFAGEFEPLYAAWDRMTTEMETVLQITKSPP